MIHLRNYIFALLAFTGIAAASASDIKGDLNGDGKLSVDDTAMLSDILIGKTLTSFSTEELDFNVDGIVNIGDLTKLVDMVANSSEGGLDVGIDGWDDTGEDLGGTLSAPRRSNEEVHIHCTESTVLEGQHTSLSISLNNSVAVNAFLLTIKLPIGLDYDEVNFEYCSLGRHSSSHIANTHFDENGNLKVLVYATDNTAFTGYDGEILFVNVVASDGRDYTLGISDAEFSDSRFRTLYAEDFAPSASIIVRNIYYYVDNELYYTQSYEYGALITPIEEPMKDGNTFSGWSEIPTYMPAEDVYVYGTFETGISDIEMSFNNFYNVYTLQGCQIRQNAESKIDLPHGIYIINNQKVLIK